MSGVPSTAKSPGYCYRALSLPLLLLWTVHALKNNYSLPQSKYFAMRSGRWEKTDDSLRIWVHASSVGEVQAVTPLVHALLERGEKLLLTSFTASGYQAIRQNFSDSIQSAVIPFDFYWQCRRFFDHYKIKLGLIMETELWPELLFHACQRDIPLLQINARLSEKSSAAPLFVRSLLRTTLGYFSLILARTAKDREKLVELGADASKVKLLGNLKSLDRTEKPPARLITREYLILASSHADEEQQFLQSRPADLKGLLLLIAPRHPHRSEAIQALMDQLGLQYAVRSKSQQIDDDTQVYLADTLGELRALMAHARIVIMGGSFNDSGGHNLLEAASLGCCIITGPSDSNISEDIRMLGSGSGVLQVDNLQQCWQQIQALLDHPERAQAFAREAKNKLAQQPDIIAAYMQTIEPWI